jgi:hypothetical protein
MLVASHGRISFWSRAAFSVALLLPSSALAQQQQASPAEQALAARLMSEIQKGVTCEAGGIGMQVELAKALAKIKELEAKVTPIEK